MKRKTKALLCFFAGIVGLILPGLPGILLIAYGIYLYFEPPQSVTTKKRKGKYIK